MINTLNNNTYRQNITINKIDKKQPSQQNTEISSSDENNKDSKTSKKPHLNANNKPLSIDEINKKLSQGVKAEDLPKEEYDLLVKHEEIEKLDFISKVMDEILKHFKVSQKVSSGEKLTNEEQEFKNTRGIVVPGTFMTKKKSLSETYSNDFSESNYSNNLDIKK
ncbi:hypothetical protein [Romboutsia lituseburensis]|uniref:hypothetical protein n=1 Tax=Romboutsia lituseburensis TaxID=1537 RepID=UPI00215AB896|nr:hypothetical protein [Romboutsia lituseburensis]MCR8747130.1 hypothetical protein [Romboutsia lituseburensis]